MGILLEITIWSSPMEFDYFSQRTEPPFSSWIRIFKCLPFLMTRGSWHKSHGKSHAKPQTYHGWQRVDMFFLPLFDDHFFQIDCKSQVFGQPHAQTSWVPKQRVHHWTSSLIVSYSQIYLESVKLRISLMMMMMIMMIVMLLIMVMMTLRMKRT